MTRTRPSPAALLSRVRLQAGLRVLLLALPWLALAVMVALRGPGRPFAWLPLLGVVAATLAWLASTWRAHHPHWLASRLNRDANLEDSAELVLGLQPADSPLGELQRSRLQTRWHTLDLDRHLPRWPAVALVGNLLAAMACMALLWSWHRPIPPALQARLPATMARLLGVQSPSIRAIRLQVDAPAYTGLATRSVNGSEARVPEFSRVTWVVQFQTAPTRAWLQIQNGPRIALQAQADGWRGLQRIDRSLLYRIVSEPALPAWQRGLHRIDMIRDQPPRVRAITPSRSLTLRSPGQRTWPLMFEASDDHGVAGPAELRIIQTSGDGENIQSSERIVRLAGSGSPRARRFAHVFDLARSGLTVGNDVIVQVSVRDNRQPRPQVVRSASVILRWPLEQANMATGLDGLVQRALPAYFRSQRQIIIDAEKLVRERRRLASETFVKRSDAIGVDQHALRLRYGQFLGEEGEEPALLPTNDPQDQGAAETTHETTGNADHDDHAADPSAPQTSHADAMLADVSHVHDLPEAATLLDPQTQAVLRAALRDMWQSEMHLRQGEPQQALPFAYKALGLIKQVQQADRIYLPRLGSELPPIDFDRRLSGKREGLVAHSNAFAPMPVAAVPLAALWQASAPERDGVPIPPAVVAAASRWLNDIPGDSSDALAALAALDGVRREPACRSCRHALRTATWPLLKPAVATPMPRTRATPAGNAYLDALQREAGR